ncbi:MAG: hypothetical protein JW726_13465 [Anaerolineales bacterium]|nr:hypothetical protein [Anaerolineales bacterium]
MADISRAGQAAMRSIALRRAIEADRLFASIFLWGPPGIGKTTASETDA